MRRLYVVVDSRISAAKVCDCTAGPNNPPKGLIKAIFTYLLHFFSFLDQTCQIDYDC